MPIHVLYIVLGAALTHATWNLFLKQTGDRMAMMCAMHTVTGMLALAAMPWVGGVIALESWPLLIASMIIHGGYYLFLIRSYTHGDLGLTYPIARGMAPLLVGGASILLLDDPVTQLQLLAFGLTAVGILTLGLRNSTSLRKHPQALLYALGTGVFIGSYTVVDGMGVRLSGNVWAYMSWLFTLEMLLTLAVTMSRFRRETARVLIGTGRKGIWAGIFSAYAYGSVMWAMNEAPIMLVSALRETSVVMASLLAVVVLKERFDPFRILAAVLVAVGVVLLKL
ncbi:MAG: EamA family transporter [SAR324 cluster bacterium]|nr:EamA family transporter [SAR324 cluster bacterium]MDP7630906.1 EamA family transporter [SAR324 cluster bacterium]